MTDRTDPLAGCRGIVIALLALASLAALVVLSMWGRPIWEAIP